MATLFNLRDVIEHCEVSVDEETASFYNHKVAYEYTFHFPKASVAAAILKARAQDGYAEVPGAQGILKLWLGTDAKIGLFRYDAEPHGFAIQDKQVEALLQATLERGGNE